jgi:SAM-dependent methyltransferase
VAPLFGRGLAGPVLRPLAERLIDAAALRPEDRLILDVPCDGGVLTVCLARSRPSGLRVVGVDTHTDTLVEAAAAGSRAVFITSSAAQLPFRGRSIDVALSLLTLPHQAEPVSILSACAGTLRGDGRVVAGVWGDSNAVPHLVALRDAVRATLKHAPSHIEEALSLGVPSALESLAAQAGLGNIQVERLRDVVRFEGVDHLWAVHAAGPLAEEAALLDDESAQALRHDLANRLLAVTAWDGTLVVPVEMAVLTAAAPG